MNLNTAKFPIILTNESEEGMKYKLEVFGFIRLSWGVEFLVFRISFADNEGHIGIGDVRLLPPEEFYRYFADFTEVPNPDLH